MFDVILSLPGLRRDRRARSIQRAGGGLSALGYIASIAILLAGFDARAIEFVVQEISVSEGGEVDGSHVSIPVGGNVTIGARVVDPAAQPVLGIGASYYGWSPNVLSFSSGSAVAGLFHQQCIPGVGAFNGLGNHVTNPLVESIASVGGASARRPRVRILVGVTIETRAANPNDPGLNGQCGGGDSQFRLTFSGIADGETTITIGTGDDLGGVIVPDRTGTTTQATNASVLVTVPEPGPGISIAVAVGWMALAGRGRHRATSRSSRASRQSDSE